MQRLSYKRFVLNLDRQAAPYEKIASIQITDGNDEDRRNYGTLTSREFNTKNLNTVASIFEAERNVTCVSNAFVEN